VLPVAEIAVANPVRPDANIRYARSLLAADAIRMGGDVHRFDAFQLNSSGFVRRSLQLHRLRQMVGTTSQNVKPSRRTTSPFAHRTGTLKSGPSVTKVWNSPFSPHGSTVPGRSRTNCSS
jgi:hypothetical protein